MYNLKDDKSIIIKGGDKGVAVIVWDREDYIKEASKQLEDKEAASLFEVPSDSSALVTTMFTSLENKETWGFVTGHTELVFGKRTQNCEV